MPEVNGNLNNDEDITPKISTDEVEIILGKIYGLKGCSLKQLQGYDDLNFHILPKVSENKFIKTLWAHGYVLKIMNSLDSKKNQLCEGQNALMLFFQENQIPSPVPVQTVRGEYYVKEKLPKKPTDNEVQKEHIIRLLQFQPGIVLKQIPKSYSLMYQLGEFVAKLDKVLKNCGKRRNGSTTRDRDFFDLIANYSSTFYTFVELVLLIAHVIETTATALASIRMEFYHPVYEKHYSVWHLHSVPEIMSMTHVIESSKRRRLVEVIIKNFTEKVLPKIDDFEKGMIHGDFNEHNVLMSQAPNGDWEVSAILDFGDSHLSCYLFELAISLCYMMLECKSYDLDPVIGAGHVLAGYLKNRPNFYVDFGLLKLCICARMCQSLTLGLKAYSFRPENRYVLDSQKMGWPILEELWKVSDDNLMKEWKSVIDLYTVAT